MDRNSFNQMLVMKNETESVLMEIGPEIGSMLFKMNQKLVT